MPLDIAAGTYPNQLEGIATVGTAALLLTTADLTRDEALLVARAVYLTGQDLLAAGSPPRRPGLRGERSARPDRAVA